MIDPAKATLTAYRWQPYVEVIEVQSPLDFGEASVTFQARLYPDQPGAPLLSLTRNDNLQAEGIAVRLEGQDADGVKTHTLQIRINETTLEALLPFPSGVEAGDDLELAYDLVIDVPGETKARWLTGAFILKPGANQA